MCPEEHIEKALFQEVPEYGCTEVRDLLATSVLKIERGFIIKLWDI